MKRLFLKAEPKRMLVDLNGIRCDVKIQLFRPAINGRPLPQNMRLRFVSKAK